MLVLENIHRAYGRIPVLRGASLVADAGEITVVLGSNGAGKSTLMRIAAGIMRADSGSVTIGGREERSLPSPVLGFVGHESLLYRALTVRENLVLTGGLRGGDYDISETLKKWGLVGVAEKPVSALSKGFEARAGIARALLHNPSIIVLDEPTTALDDAACEALLSDLVERASRGAAILMTSHDVSRVGAVAHRVLFLQGGVVQSDSRTTSIQDVCALYRGGNR